VFFLDFLGMASNRPYTRSTHGAPRDSVGGLSKVGSMGSTGLGSVPSKKTLVEEAHVAEEVVAQMDPSDEVRISESSPSDSDCDFREVIKSGGKGGRSVEPGLVTEGLLADQVYVEMPQSDRGDVGDTEGNQGGVAAAGRAEKDVGGTLKAPWVNLFKDNRNVGIGIKLDEVDVEGDLVMLEEDDVDEVEKSWGFCLVGHFAGRFPGVTAVRTITEGWKVKCTYRLHKSGWIIFRFKEEEDRLNVLNGGPYFAYGRSLLLKILPRCFRFGGEDFAIVPVWVQLPGLPLDCWNERALSKIMSRVGKPISTDKMTRTKERLSFARVLVEVDASKELVTGVDLRLPTGEVYNQQVVFEFYPKYCKKCKIFGHVDGDCKKESEGGKLSGYVPNRKVQSAGVKGGRALILRRISLQYLVLILRLMDRKGVLLLCWRWLNRTLLLPTLLWKGLPELQGGQHGITRGNSGRSLVSRLLRQTSVCWRWICLLGSLGRWFCLPRLAPLAIWRPRTRRWGWVTRLQLDLEEA